MPSPKSKIHDALILGAGPAGLSAALGLARVHRTALVLSHNSFRNSGVTAMHTVPSRDGTHPAEFRRITREQIELYGDGIQFVEAEAVRLGKTRLDDGYQGFEVEDKQSRVWKGKKMVLAMGSKDIFPKIEGYAENWPENIYQCLFCDGHERSHLPIGLMGLPPGAAATAMVMMVRNLSGDPRKVTIFSNGPVADDPKFQEAILVAGNLGSTVESRRIVRLVPAPHGEQGVDVVFEDRKRQRVGFLVDKPPTEIVGRDIIVEGLGVETVQDWSGTNLKRSEPFGESNVRGVFVAGDAGVALKQVTSAATTGVLAAGGISHQLCSEEGEKVLTDIKKVSMREIDLEAKGLVNRVIEV